MNKKLLRTVFAAFLSVFMFGTSINPAVFADGEDETVENNEGNEDAQEKGTDVRKTITAFVLGELIPDEAESTEDVALPASLPAKLEGDAEEAEPVAAGVQWTENENAFNVSLNAESNEAYVLSENAQNQLNSISVAKSEVAEEDTAEAEIQAVTDDGSAQDQQAVTEEADSEQEALLGESAVVPWDGTTVSWDPYPGASGYKCYVVLEQTEFKIEEYVAFDLDNTVTSLDVLAALNNRAYVPDGGGHAYAVTVYVTTADDTYKYIAMTDPENPAYLFYLETSVKDLEYKESDLSKVGLVTGAGWYQQGGQAEVTAIPGDGYEFLYFESEHNRYPDDWTDKSQSSYVLNIGEVDPEKGYNDRREARGYFIKSSSLATITLDCGQGHETFAGTLYNAIPAGFRAGLSGSVITLKIISDDTVGSVKSDIRMWIKEAFNIDYDSPDVLMDNGVAYGGIGLKKTEDYTSEDEYDEEQTDSTITNAPAVGHSPFYVLWFKELSTVTLTGQSLLCGTEITTFSDASDYIKCDAENAEYQAIWISDQVIPPLGPRPEPETITVVGGDTAKFAMPFRVPFGYFINAEDPRDVIKFVNIEATDINNYGIYLEIVGSLTAEHNYGDWEVTEFPTFTKEGTETRTCSACGEKETRSIPKVTYSVEAGDGQVWTSGGTGTADFEFSRSWEDEEQKQTAYDLFTGIEVDGAAVPDFTKEKGSVITKLNASYLNTLSAGEHTITAKFSDEGSVSASFTVEEDIKPEPEPEPKPDPGDDDDDDPDIKPEPEPEPEPKPDPGDDDDPDVKPEPSPEPEPSPAPDDSGKSSGGGSSNRQLTPVDNVVTCQMAGYPSNYSWNEAAKACQPGYLDAGGNFHPYKRSSVPNTGDMDLTIYAWIAMLAMTLAMYCGVKLLHEDWEV